MEERSIQDVRRRLAAVEGALALPAGGTMLSDIGAATELRAFEASAAFQEAAAAKASVYNALLQALTGLNADEEVTWRLC